MAERIIVRRRGTPLAVLEMLFSGAFFSYWACKQYSLNWILGIIIFIGSMLLMSYLFFRIRIFRYVFAIVFSFGWGFLAYAFASSATRSESTSWIALAAVFALSLFIHKAYFQFENTARRIDFRD